MMFKVGCRGGHGVWDDQMLRYRDNEEGDDEGRTREGNFRVNTPQAPPQFRHQSPRNHPFLSIFFLTIFRCHLHTQHPNLLYSKYQPAELTTSNISYQGRIENK